MLIELVKKAPLRKEGNYQKLDIEFIQDGRKKKKTLVAIADTKEVVRKIVQEFNEGDNLEIDIKKSDDGEFWNWVGVNAAVGQQREAKSSTTVKGGWETPEERARKQVYIVRQSSISNALEFHKNNGKITTAEVIKTAKVFEDYVFGSFEEEESIEEKPAKVKSSAKDADDPFQDDVPF